MPSQFNLDRRGFLGTAAMSIPAQQFGLAGREGGSFAGPLRLQAEGELPSLGGAVGWLNSQPLTPDDLRGRVVLIYIWTYTCINWRRSLPYVCAWYEKCKGNG